MEYSDRLMGSSLRRRYSRIRCLLRKVPLQVPAFWQVWVIGTANRSRIMLGEDDNGTET